MNQFWITAKKNNDTAEIFLYGFINPMDVSSGDFVKELKALEKEYRNIRVRINSAGGSVFEGLAIYNAMIQSTSYIETYIDGLAASMASIIALGGKKVYMSRSARVMTHGPSVGTHGDSEEHKRNAQLLDGLEKTFLAIYSAKTGKKESECKTAFMNGKDNWFDATQAKATGLIDEIYDLVGAESPKETKDAKNVWELYSKQEFAAVFNNSNNEMKQYNLSAATLAAMKLTNDADTSAIEGKITELIAEAGKVPQLILDLTTARNDKKVADDALAALKTTTVKNEVKSIIDKALTDKKMTVEMSKVLEVQFAEKPSELKALVDTMKSYESKVPSVDNTDADKVELTALAAMSGDKIYAENKFDRLKELDASGTIFKMKYKEAFGEEPK